MENRRSVFYIYKGRNDEWRVINDNGDIDWGFKGAIILAISDNSMIVVRATEGTHVCVLRYEEGSDYQICGLLPFYIVGSDDFVTVIPLKQPLLIEQLHKFFSLRDAIMKTEARIVGNYVDAFMRHVDKLQSKFMQLYTFDLDSIDLDEYELDALELEQLSRI